MSPILATERAQIAHIIENRVESDIMPRRPQPGRRYQLWAAPAVGSGFVTMTRRDGLQHQRHMQRWVPTKIASTSVGANGAVYMRIGAQVDLNS